MRELDLIATIYDKEKNELIKNNLGHSWLHYAIQNENLTLDDFKKLVELTNCQQILQKSELQQVKIGNKNCDLLDLLVY